MEKHNSFLFGQMKKIFDDKIVLTDFPHFSVKDTLECGQIFRYKQAGEGVYEVFSQDKWARLKQSGTEVVIETDDPAYFDNFFDLSSDYQPAIDRILAKNAAMKDATDFGGGIRILRQDLAETIFSFIVSANNNIKRIQSIIERICAFCGEKTAHGYAFPSIEALAQVGEENFARLGAGYRARYLHETANALLDFDLSSLASLDTPNARKTLLSFCGVGPKVADCILLFGMGRGDVFPVDTWIKKVYHTYFEAGHADDKISAYLVSLFGEDSGVCQQYLFHFQRKA